ncbi:hypothetical protein Vretimale_8196 [Volvox reticuliferus]|uniref:Uncharacterized protein n=1 Tax=Volvox reticuliferus TaxID=1737510 RepID=A0A8J4GAN0_9CHLO|nr:hypothetical protein Vretimale_8196 [Volvox reticuliferus]
MKRTLPSPALTASSSRDCNVTPACARSLKAVTGGFAARRRPLHVKGRGRKSPNLWSGREYPQITDIMDKSLYDAGYYCPDKHEGSEVGGVQGRAFLAIHVLPHGAASMYG